MAETITPVVHGGRTASYKVTIALHVLGTSLSAALLGGVLGLAGGLLGAPWHPVGPAAVAVVALLYALREGAGLPVPLPGRRRQVPEWWRTFFSTPVAALLYGLGLGAGFLSHLVFGTFVAVAAAALVSGNPAIGTLVSLPFGLARGLSVLVSARARDGEEAAEVVERLGDAGSGITPRAVNAAVLAAVGAAAALSL
jgi:hypothetical protein